MGGRGGIDRIVADTDALLFWGQSGYLQTLVTNVGITTTTACVQEVCTHANKDSTDRFGLSTLSDDEQRRKDAAERIRPYLDPGTRLPPGIVDTDLTISVVQCGDPSVRTRSSAGERSIARLVSDHPKEVEFVAMMDTGRNDDLERGGRDLVKSATDNWNTQGISFVSPAPILALLVVNGIASETGVCADIARLIDSEGWPEVAWRNVPLGCSEGPAFLPQSL